MGAADAINANAAAAGQPAAVPAVSPVQHWSQGRYAGREDLDRCIGLASRDPHWGAALCEWIGAWLRRSAAGFPASVPGL